MLAPSFTTHLLRSLHRELGSTAQLNEYGVDLTAVMPSIESNINFGVEYLLYNVARKRDVFAKDETPTKVLRDSLAKWAEAEYSCKVVNRYGRYYSSIIKEDQDLLGLLHQKARSHIDRILSDRWPDYTSADYTSGASNHLPKAYSCIGAKWIGYARPDRNQSVVTTAEEHLREIMKENPAFAYRLYRKRWKLVEDHPDSQKDYTEEGVEFFKRNITSISKLDYVPKDFKTVRMIMATGEGTMLCQSVFGRTIRSALADEGVDLQDQSINRKWALSGSIDGKTATVDLSSASDTLSNRLVASLLPKRWLSWLRACRDAYVHVPTQVRGKRSIKHKLAKFASMGNGFCFELESLIFYAMAKACVDVLGADTSCVSVYGDDIIIPSEAYTLLERYFLHWGLFINNDKTFAGPQGFRESCGGHFYNGKDVTPFYVKGEILSVSDCFHFYNRLQEWSNRTGINTPDTLNMVLAKIPMGQRVLVPATYGTRAGLHSYCEGIILPRRVYNKDYMSFVETQRVCSLEKEDATEKWCDRTRLLTWFASNQNDECTFSFLPIGAPLGVNIGKKVRGIGRRLFYFVFLDEKLPARIVTGDDVVCKWRVGQPPLEWGDVKSAAGTRLQKGKSWIALRRNGPI